MGRIGIRIANVALFVLSCFLTADVINQISGSLLIPDHPAAIETEHDRLPAQLPWQARQAILDRNLFGAQVVSDQPLVEEPIVEQLQDTKLPLQLLGTIASEDQRVASAAIENTQDRQHEVVQVGDHLKSHAEVKVARIDRGRVILQNGPRREELKLSEQSPRTEQPKRVSRRSKRNPKSAKDRLKRLAEQRGDRSPAAIFSQARILPKYDGGEMVGIELTKIKPDSFYEKVGLQDGDVVKSLNGIKIDSPSASKELLGVFTKSSEIVAEVERAGQTQQLNVSASELARLGLGPE